MVHISKVKRLDFLKMRRSRKGFGWVGYWEIYWNVFLECILGMNELDWGCLRLLEVAWGCLRLLELAWTCLSKYWFSSLFRFHTSLYRVILKSQVGSHNGSGCNWLQRLQHSLIFIRARTLFLDRLKNLRRWLHNNYITLCSHLRFFTPSKSCYISVMDKYTD